MHGAGQGTHARTHASAQRSSLSMQQTASRCGEARRCEAMRGSKARSDKLRLVIVTVTITVTVNVAVAVAVVDEGRSRGGSWIWTGVGQSEGDKAGSACPWPPHHCRVSLGRLWLIRFRGTILWVPCEGGGKKKQRKEKNLGT